MADMSSYVDIEGRQLHSPARYPPATRGKLLRGIRVDVNAAMARVAAIATALLDHASDLTHPMRNAGLEHPLVEQLPSPLAESAMEKLGKLSASSAANNPT